MNTIIISIISVFVGWFLGQGSELLKNFVSSIKLKKSLLLELHDIKEELIRTSAIFERKLQIYSLKGIESSVPLELSHYYFQNFYKDVFNKLKREQRLSYQIIHAHVNALNDSFKELNTITEICHENIRKGAVIDKINPVEKWGDYIKAEYRNVMETLWHVDYHLLNPGKPDLTLFSKTHEKFIKFHKDIDEKIENIISKAKKLDRKDFE